MRPALAVLLLGLGGCAGQGQARPDVVLVTIDTLRADRLPAYGYGGVETPALDALQREAVLFEEAQAHVPLTLPSHAGLLTGLLPPQHGVRDNVGYRLDPRTPTLPGLLRGAGYTTGGFVSAFVLRGSTGLSSGFDRYDDQLGGRPGQALGELQRPGVETVRRALDWLASVPARPVFLFVHLYEPHAPHEPPEPLAARWGATYEGEVAAADAAFGQLREGLQRLGRWNGTLLVLTADHGEGLGDHGEAEHGILLHREVLRVPLLVKLPGGERGGSRVKGTVSHVDLLPTVLAACRIAAPPGLPGRTLDAAAREPRPAYAETWYPRIHLGWSPLFSLAEAHRHLIDGPRPELYDTAEDPGEQRDLAAAQAEQVSAMRRHIAGTRGEFRGPTPEREADAEALRSLGYLAGGAPAAAPSELPNPKDHLGVHAEIVTALGLARSGQDAAAVAALRGIATREPGLFDVWAELGAALFRLGRPSEAAAAFTQAAAVSPTLAASLGVSRGQVLLALDRLGEAETQARAALQVDAAGAHLLLARIALARGDLESALREARAVAGDPAAERSAVVLQAEVEARRGRPEQALRVLEAAGAGGDPVPGLAFVRGDVLARLGRDGLAEQAFREEIAAFPRQPRAYASLAVLLASQGRIAEGEACLARMREAAPGVQAERLERRIRDLLARGT